MAGVSIRLEGDRAAAAAARQAADRAANPQGVWNIIGALLVTSTLDRFERESDPAGNPWPKSIRAMAEGGRTLTDSSYLKNSITFETFAGGVAVGTNAIQAAIHQFGGVITAKTDAGLMFKIGDHFVRKQSVTMPMRAFLGVDRDDEQEIAIAWEEWLGEPVGGISAH